MPAFLPLLFIFSFFQNDVPLKPKEEFELRLNYEFKNRAAGDRYKVDFNETVADRDKKLASSSPLPFLTLSFEKLKLPNNEVRVRGYDDEGRVVVSRKIVEQDKFQMILGFTDDLKDRVSPHEYNIYFITAEKKQVNRIHLFVAEDGTFTVNGEVKGKF